MNRNTLFDTRLGDVSVFSPTNAQGGGIQFGLSSATLSGGQGNITVQANAGTFVSGTGADVVMASFVLPSLTFDQAGRGIEVKAFGSTLANGNTKTIKLIFNPSSAVLNGTVGAGGTIIATTGAITTGGSGWFLTAQVFKYGILASNTQVCLSGDAQSAAATLLNAAPQLATAIEANPILVCLTGNAVTAGPDISWNLFQINAMN